MKSLVFLILTFFVLQTKYITAQITFTRNCPNFQINIQKSGSSNPTTIGSLVTYSDCSSTYGFYVGKNGTVLKRAVWQWNISDTDIPDGSTIHSVTIKLRKSSGPSEINLNYFDVGLNISDPNLNLNNLWDLTDKNLNTPIGTGHGNNSTNNIVSSTFTNSSDPFIIALRNSLVSDRFSLGFAWTQDSPSSGDNQYLFFREEPCLTISFTPPSKSVVLDQRLSNNQQVGVLKKWEGTQFTPYPYITPGTAFDFPVSSTQTILGDQIVHSSQKYNNWNELPDVKNYHSFLITSGTTSLISNFKPTNTNVLLKNSLEGTSVTGGTLFFRDPWFVDFPDPEYDDVLRNGGMDQATFRNRTSPFYPDATTSYENGQKYNGVFLNQNPQFQYDLPIYKLWAGDQLINLGGTLGIRTFYFQDWSSNQYATLQKYGSDANVVFTGADAVVQANYKGHMLSNHSAALNSQQKKMIHILEDVFYLAYESMDKCWVTAADWGYSEDWSEDTELSKKNSSLNPLASYKNPSVDNVGETVFIAFEYLEPGSSTAYIMLAKDYSYNTGGQCTIEIIDSYPASFFGQAKPLISAFAYGTGNNMDELFILYKKSSSAGAYFRNYAYRSGSYNWGQIESITSTSGASVNFSVAADKQSYSHKLHIVYEENASTIKYLYLNAFPVKLPGGQTTISSGSPYPNNYSPSVSVTGQGKVVASWTGQSGTIIGKGNGTEGAAEYKTIIRPYESSWGNFQVAGNNVSNTYSSSTTNTSQSQSIISWNENQNTTSKYLRRLGTSYCATNTLTPNGIMPVVSAASNLSEARALILNTSTTPYGLYKSTTNFNSICEFEDEGDLEKITDVDAISYGRTGLVFINGVGFIFQTGDVVIGDSTIQFVHRPDTINYQNASELNEVVRTKTFSLDQNSNFLFSNKYYTLYGELADTALIATDNVSFRVELVNAATQNVIGTFDNITYDKHNLEKFENISYQVNCSGIQAGEYYLRLVTTVNGIAEYNLANVQSDASELEKNNFASVYFDGNGLPLTYEISQNYPNPFNPSTVINYQIPNDGLVTIKVYDILGKEITTLVNENKSVGRYSVQFNGNNLASGVYIYRINSGDFVSSKKMMLIK